MPLTSSELASPAAAALQSRIQARTARVGIIGLGYVGLPLSLVFTQAGFPVLGFDTDPDKVASLAQARSYIRHIGEDEVRRACASGRFQATGDFSRLAGMDAVLICVPTPLNRQREPDLSFVEASAQAVARNLRAGQLVVLESSTYPGTTDEVVVPILEAAGAVCRGTPASPPSGHRVFVAFSPEREDPGNRQFTTRTIPKLVGGVDEEAGQVALELYRSAFAQAVPVSSARVAEMAKILENTYRCVNIALVNELKQLCLRMGIDIFEVIDAAATKPFGFQPFYPGPGLGGHCIPIDPYYLSWKAREYDFTARFIELAGEINTEMPYHAVQAVADALNRRAQAVRGARILILGVAYKKDIDDLRESPALKIIALLQERGAQVVYNDPHCPRIWPGRHSALDMESEPFQPPQAADYDAVVIATDHSAYDFPAIAAHARLLVDTRNATRGLRHASIVRC